MGIDSPSHIRTGSLVLLSKAEDVRLFGRELKRPETPIESLPNAPEIFYRYRRLANCPSLTREPGGWIYHGKFYPDYLTVGGCSHAIARIALQYCHGKGVDIGAGLWPLPGATPIDEVVGIGTQNKLAMFQDDSLDYIFSSHCLEHIAGWQTALLEWVRKLKASGILFLYLPHPDCEIWHPTSPFINGYHKWIPTPPIIKTALYPLNCELIAYDDGPDAMQSFYICSRRRI